jgi:hypothetical protein
VKVNPGSAASVTISGAVDVKQLGADTLTSYGPVTIANTATLIFAAAATTCRVFIQAATSNTEAVYIGDSGLTDPGTTEDGFPLTGGQGLELLTSDAVYGISDTGGQKVYLIVIGQS